MVFIKTLVDVVWTQVDIQAFMAAVHNHRTCREVNDVDNCIEADVEQACPAHSLLDDPDVRSRMLAIKRIVAEEVITRVKALTANDAT